MQMKNIIVIGGSGSLGKGISNKLKDDYNITSTYCNNKFEAENINTVQVDITDYNSLKNIDGEFDTAVLVAGAMPAEMKGYTPQKYIDVNITGVKNVLDFCLEKKIKKIIYIMTFSDVSSSFHSGIPIKENAPRTLTYTGDHSFYGITKVTACELIEHYHQEYGLQTIIFRIPTVYCNDSNFNYYVNGVLKTKAYVQMIKSIIKNNRIEVWGNPNNAKDMPYIKDFANLIKLAVQDPKAQGLYNAGTSNPISLEELVNTMIDVFGEGKEIEKIYKPNNNSQPNFTFDMSKTFSQFNYKTKYDIKSMLLDIKKSVGVDTFK